MNSIIELKWRFRSNAKLIIDILRYIGFEEKDRKELLDVIINDCNDKKYKHKVSTIICKLINKGLIKINEYKDSNKRHYLRLTDHGRWLLLCYIFNINPLQLAILALLYNNYHRSVKNEARWIVPLVRKELESLLHFYNKEYLLKQIRKLCNMNLCTYAYDNNCIILNDEAYGILNKFHNDILSLYRHIMQISDLNGEPYAYEI